MNHQALSSFIWSVADLLRGDYKQSDYGKVILPFTVLRRLDCVLAAGGKTCPPTIVGVGIGGTADLCMHLAKVAATRPLGSHCEDPEGAKLEQELSEAVNLLGVGPQGLGGDSTSFAVHVETAATHITMNPVAVNMQCHSARRARATFRPPTFRRRPASGKRTASWASRSPARHSA